MPLLKQKLAAIQLEIAYLADCNRPVIYSCVQYAGSRRNYNCRRFVRICNEA